MGGGSSGNTTSTQRQEPPDYVKPFLLNAANESQRLYSQGPAQYYPGQTVTPFSNETEQALQRTTNRATAGSPVTNAASTYVTNTLSKPITSEFGAASNPYLDQTFNRAADSVQNRIQSGFAGSGRNIEAGRPLAAQEYNDLAASIYGGAYESERNRRLQDISGQRAGQLGALGAATGLADQDYKDLGQLAQVGATREDLTSRQIADDVSRYDFAQNAPGIALDQYIQRLNNQPGGSASATTPYYRNRAAGGLGGATLGYQLGNNFGYGGWGALLGGLLGAYG